MSVSDPLLKNFKSYVYSLCKTSGQITDRHVSLQTFCQLLELILRKGLKQSTSVFELSRHRDYWHWIEQLSLMDTSGSRVRKHPLIDVIVQRINSSSKVVTDQGRGRLFLREVLQNKLIVNVVDLLVSCPSVLLCYYDQALSIMADEILFQIFKSLLMQTSELSFDLCIDNQAFLDDTWKLSVYKEFMFVPCRDLGMGLYHANGRVIVTAIDKGSIADDCGEIEAGDVLDEMFGKSLRNIVRGTIPKLLKRNYGQPVKLSVIKGRDADGCIFPPIGELIKSMGMSVDALQKSSGDIGHQSRKPPHALLPDEVEDEVPVHGINDGATYCVEYVGKVNVGQDGGIIQIDPAILRIAIDKNQQVVNVMMELSETEILSKKRDSDEILMKVSYTEVSSCGRRNDYPKYFAYIAGETTCTLAKDFTAHVFRAASDEEAKIIICTIAQGFSRTHWFV